MLRSNYYVADAGIFRFEYPFFGIIACRIKAVFQFLVFLLRYFKPWVNPLRILTVAVL